MAIETVRLPVGGMTCVNCARSVERKLTGTAGVIKATVNLEAASAAVEYDSGRVQPDQLADAVRQLGYEVPA